MTGLTGGPGGPGGPFGPNRPRGPCKRNEQGCPYLAKSPHPSAAPGKSCSLAPLRAFAATQVSTSPQESMASALCSPASPPHPTPPLYLGSRKQRQDPAINGRLRPGIKGVPSEQGETFKSRGLFHTRSGQAHTKALLAEATKTVCCTVRLCPRLITGSSQISPCRDTQLHF